VKEKASNVVDRTSRSAADSTITSKVKAGLLADNDLKGMDINVDTEKGVVMLSGFVESKAEADKAVRLAKDVEGVTKVKNSLKVK
jgi:osmotically-inducible protein OsmY